MQKPLLVTVWLSILTVATAGLFVDIRNTRLQVASVASQASAATKHLQSFAAAPPNGNFSKVTATDVSASVSIEDVPLAGQSEFRSVTLNNATGALSLNNQPIRAYYGDSTDGVGTFDTVATPAGTTLSVNTYTLTRDVFYTSATVSNTATIKTNGYRFFVTGTLDTSGTFDNSGGAGGNGTGSGSCTQGAAGIGNTIGGAPGVGAASGGGAAGGNNLGSWGGVGGAGGNGGTSGGAAGQGAFASTRNTAVDAINGYGLSSVSTAGSANVNFKSWQGGGGGGSGGGTSADEGCGGGGGGAIVVAAFILTGNGIFSANGGAGGNAVAGGGAGGGGGGGWIAIVSTYSGGFAGTVSVAGGNAGTGGSGAAAVGGSSGHTFIISG